MIDHLIEDVCSEMLRTARSAGLEVNPVNLKKGVRHRIYELEDVLTRDTILSFSAKDWAITLSQCGKNDISLRDFIMEALSDANRKSAVITSNIKTKRQQAELVKRKLESKPALKLVKG